MNYKSIYEGELKFEIAKANGFDRIIKTSTDKVFTIKDNVEVNEKGIFSNTHSFYVDIIEINRV